MLVVVDGVFSMEGDIAPLREICELCERYGARLMVDEAHGAGVLGARGAGTAELLGVADRVDLRMGTFSKSLASCGGFVAGPAEVIEYLRIYSRAFLFTASAVPGGGRGGARGAARAALAPTARRCWRGCSTTPGGCATACTSSASPSSPRSRCPPTRRPGARPGRAPRRRRARPRS